MKKKYTSAAWDGDKAKYSIEQLLNAVPKAIAQWAKKKGSGEVAKDDLKLPFKTPDGTISLKGIDSALEDIGGAHGNKPDVPSPVMAAAKKELEREQKAGKKALGKDGKKTPPKGGTQNAGTQNGGTAKQAAVDLGPDDSLPEHLQDLQEAIREQFRTTDGLPRYWFEDASLEYVILGCYEDGALYKMSYAVNPDDDDDIVFGEPVEVEEPDSLASQYVEVQEGDDEGTVGQSAQLSTVTLRQSVDPEGWAWRCQVVKFGMSKTRDIWERAQFVQSLPKWEGVPCYRNHPTVSQMRELPERSIDDKIGWWTDFAVTGQGTDATLHIKPSADWMRRDLLAAYKAGKVDLYEFSILVQTRYRQVNGPDGHPARLHEITKPISIDAVTEGAADGQVKYALASVRANSGDEGEAMNKTWLMMLFKRDSTYFQQVRQSLFALNARGVTSEATEEQLADAICASEVVTQQAAVVMQTIDAMGKGDAGTGERERTARQSGGTQTQPPKGGTQNPGTANRISMEQLPPEFTERLIRQAYSESGLPEGVIQKLKTRLGAEATLGQVASAIEDARDIAGVISQASINNPARVTAEQTDKLSIAVAKAFELSREDFNGITGYYDDFVRQSAGKPFESDQDLWNSVDAIKSLRSFYELVTGDVSLRGNCYTRTMVRQANWLTTDFSTLLGNVVNKRLIRDYRDLAYPLDRIMVVKSLRDFKQQEAILLGYFGNLPSVAQNAVYTNPAALTNTQETYTAGKYGYIVALTIEDIANDDLGGFVRIVSRLGRSAKRTLAAFVLVTNVMSNPTMNADSLAVFHASHNNLITDMLSTVGLQNALNLLLNQTEPGSSQKLAVTTDDLTLWVNPGDLLGAQTITDFNNSPGGEQQGMAQTIRRLGITPVAANVFTGAHSWLLTASPKDVDMVEIGFFNGQQEPEFFTQADPTQGDSFGQDVVMKHKIRHIYGGVPVDYRGMVMSSVIGG
jgi:hypothetical protein